MCSLSTTVASICSQGFNCSSRAEREFGLSVLHRQTGRSGFKKKKKRLQNKNIVPTKVKSQLCNALVALRVFGRVKLRECVTRRACDIRFLSGISTCELCLIQPPLSGSQLTGAQPCRFAHPSVFAYPKEEIYRIGTDAFIQAQQTEMPYGIVDPTSP
jgi:hypothetical protein